MPLQGTFDVLDFTEVLRLLSRHQLTGRLHVRHRSFGANLFIESGQLTGADQSEHQPAAGSGDVRGRIEEICFEMLEAERGSFEFQPGKASALPVSTRYRVDTVLGQARKRLDEWRELQEMIPSLELQPRLVGDLAQSEVTIDKERWRMLTSIDGRRNLRAIGRILNVSDFDVCRVLAGLMKDRVVELDGLASLSAATRDAMPTVAGPEPSDRMPAAVGGRQTVGIRTSGFRTATSRPSDGERAARGATVDGGAPADGPAPGTGRGSNGKARKATAKARREPAGDAGAEVVDITSGTQGADPAADSAGTGVAGGNGSASGGFGVTGSNGAGSHGTGSDGSTSDGAGGNGARGDEPRGGDDDSEGDIVARVFGPSPEASTDARGDAAADPDGPAVAGGVDAKRRRIVRIRTRHAPGHPG